MTAPAINGTRYPQPVDALLPEARKLVDEHHAIPSRNALMRHFRIGAPKADELRALLVQPGVPVDTEPTEEPADDPWQYAEPASADPAPTSISTGEPTPVPSPPAPPPAGEAITQVSPTGHPGTPTPTPPVRRAVAWPVVLLALPAFVAIWSGWVGLGGLTGFGVVHPLPGIADSVSLNTAITLPIGVETYGAYALYVWLSGRVPDRARRFAMWSALGSLTVGAAGQVAYHLLVAPPTGAPWWITTAVSVLPVLVLGMGAALAHLVRESQ